MKKTVGTALVVLAGLSIVAGLWVEQARAQGAKTAVVWPAVDIKWSDNPAMKGAKIAVLWGNPKTGAYGALKTIPGGGSLPLHTHSHDQKVISISGTILLSIEAGPAKDLTSGSYAFIPGGLKHSAECKAEADCTYFEEQAGASDIKLVEGTAQKK